MCVSHLFFAIATVKLRVLNVVCTVQSLTFHRLYRFTAFKELTHHLLNSMIGYVSLPAVIQIILQDPAYSGGKFGEIRELLIGK